MYFAGCDPETNRRLTEEAGLAVARDEFETMIEPEGEVRWQWLLARRTQSGDLNLRGSISPLRSETGADLIRRARDARARSA
jgi:hypothetical protein